VSFNLTSDRYNNNAGRPEGVRAGQTVGKEADSSKIRGGAAREGWQLFFRQMEKGDTH